MVEKQNSKFLLTMLKYHNSNKYSWPLNNARLGIPILQSKTWMCTHAKLLQWCPTLRDPMDHSLPGSSVHGILQGRILEWVTMPSSGESSWPRDWAHVSYVSSMNRQVLYHYCYLGSPIAVIMGKQISSFHLGRYKPRKGMSGIYDNTMLIVLRNDCTFFHSRCTILHFHQQCYKHSNFSTF